MILIFVKYTSRWKACKKLVRLRVVVGWSVVGGVCCQDWDVCGVMVCAGVEEVST